MICGTWNAERFLRPRTKSEIFACGSGRNLDGGLRVTVVASMCWSGVECGWKCGIVLLTKIRVPPDAGPSVIRSSL
ncbi:hypothetical protein TNCV_3219821 [Trichonephila clavipes]|nr:hypothetical protein TNCV_3219821 [Trichonephila clavipes]